MSGHLRSALCLTACAGALVTAVLLVPWQAASSAPGSTGALKSPQARATKASSFAQTGAYALPRSREAPNPGALSPEQAWQGFLSSYLRFEYGQGGKLAELTGRLRGWLLANPPQVPAAVKALRPEVSEIQLLASGSDRIEALAVVTDQAGRYTVLGSLQHSAAGWQVARLQPWG